MVAQGFNDEKFKKIVKMKEERGARVGRWAQVKSAYQKNLRDAN